MAALARVWGLLALLATSAGCLATNSDNLLSAFRNAAHPDRNEAFDPATLVGMEWTDASRLIREKGWLCEFTGQVAAAMPPEIDFTRLSSERQQEIGHHRLLIGVKDGKVVFAQKTHIL